MRIKRIAFTFFSFLYSSAGAVVVSSAGALPVRTATILLIALTRKRTKLINLLTKSSIVLTSVFLFHSYYSITLKKNQSFSENSQIVK